MIRNRCIIVLGMHRSGTSALTGVLSLLGIDPGNSLLPPVEGVNPKGFWEHAEIVAIHDNLLEALGSSWEDVSPLPDQWWLSSVATGFRDQIVDVLRRDFSDQPIWLVKDPRMCRLLPMWQDVFRILGCQPLFVLALRKPSEVAYSLRNRNGMDEAESCLLWLAHMLEAEYQTRGQPRAFIAYDRLLSDWTGTIAHIGDSLGLNWPTPPENASPEIEAFLDPALHHSATDTPPDNPSCRLAQRGFELLSGSADTTELDHFRKQTLELMAHIGPLSKRLRNCEKQGRELRAAVANIEFENNSLRSEISRIKGTVSWQLTKPFRFIRNKIASPDSDHQ